MDIVEAIQKRRSIRAYKTDLVPLDILKNIISLAERAPSSGNIQPWEFTIVSGKKLDQIKKGLADFVETHPNHDIPGIRVFPEPYDSRRLATAPQFLSLKGIRKEDREGKGWWHMHNLNLFGAPHIIYIWTDRSIHSLPGGGIHVWPSFDCGLIAENIMLLATNYGLGTVPMGQSTAYPDMIRKILDIPDSKVLVLGIAIGYPDWDDAINQLHTEREPLDVISKWYED